MRKSIRTLARLIHSKAVKSEMWTSTNFFLIFPDLQESFKASRYHVSKLSSLQESHSRYKMCTWL